MLELASYAAPQAWVRARRSSMIQAGSWWRLLEADSLESFVLVAQETPRGEHVSLDLVLSEKNLARALAGETYALRHFVSGSARAVLAWYARRPELDNLKTVLRALHYRQSREQAAARLLPLDFSALDWAGLLASSSITALIEQLKGSVYARPLGDALERYQQEGVLFFLEVSLDLAYFQRLVRLVARLGSGGRRQAEAFLGFDTDVQNLLWAYRYLTYAHLTPEEILNYTLHRAYRVDVATVRRIAMGAPLHQEAGRLGIHLPAGLTTREALSRVEQASRRLLFARAEQTLRGLTFHLGVLLAYGVLLETELADMITLLEGKSRGLRADELAPRLIREVPSVRA